jgi:glycosyltransferase involved in cell wall biosynthesis
MPELPLVSIVTPSYNQGRYLRRAIDSVLGQTYPRIEFVVIDGGSTDDSLDVLRSYGDRFAWVSEPDRGQTHALNKGFARIRGSIRAFLCSDDLLKPDAVAKAVAHFGRHADCDVVYGRADLIDENDTVLGLYETEPFALARLAQTCYICQPAAFWRAQIADRVGPFDERFNHSMDYEYWLRVALVGGRFDFIPDLLASARVHGGSRTLTEREHVFRANIAITSGLLGQADIGFFRGLWYHRTYEKPTGWPRLGRGVPKFVGLMSYLHYGLHHARLRLGGQSRKPVAA